jgi:UDP-glucuronate 4-epimerase
VEETFADIEPLARATGYTPQVSLQQGLDRFARWYRDYYKSA